MATPASLEAVQIAYIAYYGRPADPAGLEYWAERVDQEGGLDAVIDAFGNTAEAMDLFGSLSNEEMVNTLYNQIFNRDAEQAGIDYWVEKLDSGELTASSIALTLAMSAQNDDLVTLQNRVAVADKFTEALDSEAEQDAYVGNDAGNVARELISTVDVNTNPSTFYGVDNAIAEIVGGSATHTFVLQENYTEGTPGTAGTPDQRVVYWGYNPQDVSDGHGIPVTTLMEFLTSITGMDLEELGLIDDNGQEMFDSVTSLVLGDVFQGDGSSGTLTIDYADGNQTQAEVALGEEYMDFLRELLFDENGESRLYEVVIEGEEGTGATAGELIPIILTPNQNNGGTTQPGMTSAADDLIIAGRLDLLHQASIDGGAGYNTLEIDAKGSYAQPLLVQNVQEVQVQNLPNIYGENSATYPDTTTSGSDSPSIVDLSRVIDIEKLIVTEGYGNGTDLGDLIVLGVRNGADLRLEGSFTETVTLHYGEGMSTDGLNLQLNLGDTQSEDFDLNVSHNSATLNVAALGAENWIHDANLGGQLRFLNVTGEGSLTIDGNVAESFIDTRPATIDATQAGGGVDLTFDGQPVVVFMGSQAGDEFTAANGENATLTGGNGANHFNTDGTRIVSITSGDASDVISSRGSEEVSIEAGAGDNRIDTAGAQEVEINAADGDNEVVATGATELVLTLGNGDNTVDADGSENVTLTLGDGANEVTAVGGRALTMTLGDGGNTVVATGETITLTTGTGNDTATLAAMDTEALLNVDLGTGQNSLTIGTEERGVVALDDSTITGENIALLVENDSDLSRASLTGVTEVTLKGELTLTADQVAALGADALNVYRESFGETQNLHIIVTEDVVLSDLLDMDQLSNNVRLNFDLRNGAELTLSAQELHEHVAWQGIDSSDGLNGRVVITGAGTSFDPFDAGDDYEVVDGGSLTGNFDASTDVDIEYVLGGYDRPAPQPSTAVLTVDSDLVPVVEDIYDGQEDGMFANLAQTLKIQGGQDIVFETALDLSDDGYSVDFEDFEHNVTGLTLADFQDVVRVEGNGTPTRDVRIDVMLSGENIEVGEPGEIGGLRTSGVQTYVVTDISDEDSSYSDHEEATIYLSDNSEDLLALGLQGNFNATLNLMQVHWGVELLLEGDGKVLNNLQSAGHPAFSNVGTLNVEYAYDHSPVVVNLNNQGVATDRPLNVTELNIANAGSITFNIEDADAVIGSINNATGAGEFLDGKSDEVRELIFMSDHNVTVKGQIAIGELETLNAYAVDGTFALLLSGENDLSDVALDGVDMVKLADNASTLTLTNEQLQVIGEDKVTGQGELTVILSGGVFDSSALDSDLTVNVISAAGDWTLDAATDLTEIDQLTIAEGSTLTMTAEQALQLADTPVVNGGEGAQINITGATQADIDAGLESLLTTLADSGLEGRLGLAEDLTLTATTLNAAATGGFTLVGEVAGLRVDVVMDEANADAGVNQVGTDPVHGIQSEGVAVFVITQLDANADDIVYVCNDTVGLETLGLQGNGGDSVTIAGIKRGVTFLLEGDGAADWSEVEKDDLTPDFSSIGAFNATYFTPGATAIVDINNQGVELGGASDGGERYISVDAIHIDNATTISLNVADGDAIISSLDGDTVETLNLVSSEDLYIQGVLPETLSTIDAAGVTGLFIATLEEMDGAFSLTTGANALVTLNGVDAEMGSEIDGAAGTLALIVTESDLSVATLTGVDTVSITEGSSLTLSADQVLDITPAAIGGSEANTGNAHEVLNVVELSDQLIDVNALGTDVVLGTVTLASGTYTLDPATDLSGAEVLIPADATVTLTADQYMALSDIDGIAAGATLNITGLTQAHIDAGFSLTGVSNATGSVALAEDVHLLTSTDLNGFSVDMADDLTLGLATRDQADGLTVTGGANTTLVYMFVSGWSATDDTIDASGYDVTELHLLSDLVSQHDVELLQNLSGDVTVVVFNDPSMLAFAEATYRSVIIEEGVTVDDWVVFNDYQYDREVAVLDMTFRGDASIDGNLRLTTVLPEDPADPDNVNDSIYNHLQSLVITSEGEQSNAITGDIDPTVAVVNTVDGVSTTENNLLNVIINAATDFTVGGKIRFNAIGDDVVGTNDDEAAVLTVNVDAGQSVVINDLDTNDEDVTGLTVNHTGDGALTFGLSTVATVDGSDEITVNGSATGETTIVVDTYDEDAGSAGAALDLSDDTLSNVDAIVLANNSELTLSVAQVEAMGGLAGITTENLGESATLNLVGLGSDAFDASAVTNGIDLATVTILDTNAVVTLDAATDLTGIDELVVPAGTTLELTAAQFQQLEGVGTISGAGTVNITDLSLADLENGLDLSLISAVNGTLTFAEDVVFGVDDDLGGFTLEIADGQMITLSSQAQADDREVNGVGATSTLVLGFELLDALDTELGAGGYNVTDLYVMDRLVEYYNGQNVEALLQDLSSTVDVTIFDITNAPSEIAPGAMTTDRTVFIQAGATVDTQIVFNDLEDGVEVSTLDLTLGGGSTIDGNLDLSTIEPAPGSVTLNYFQTLTIRSEGDSANTIVDAIHGNGSTAGYAENNLRDINIIASADLNIGEIEFSSLRDNRTAELDVSVDSGVTVTIDDLDTDDDDIDALIVTHTGAGDLTIGLSTVATVDASDLVTINGSAAGETTLVIDTYNDDTETAGAPFDLSDDVLVNVDAIVLTNGSELTLTLDQLDAIGGLGSLTVENAGDNASVNILGLDGREFDATDATPGIDIVDVTIGGSGATVTLDENTNLTDIDRLIVPEGKVLNLTAEQFQQLAGSGTIVGEDGTTDFTVNITDLTQADVDLDGGLDITGIAADNITLALAEDVNLNDETLLGDLTKLEVLLTTGQELGLANATQASGLVVTGPEATLTFMFDDVVKGYVDFIDASNYDLETLQALNTFIDGRNIEQILQDLASEVTLSLYHSPEDLGFVGSTTRTVVVQEGVSIPGFVVVNDLDGDTAVKDLTIDLQGGAEIDGNVYLSTVEPAAGLIQQYFETLTVLSTGESANRIDGDITAQPGPDAGMLENNLTDVAIQADQDLTITGDILFSSVDAGDFSEATLTVSGESDVTIQQLDISDDELATLTIDHQGTGTLTATGASPALFDGDADGSYTTDSTGNLETLNLEGTGDIVLGNADGGWGITASGLSLIDASDLSGDLNLGEVRDIDSSDFTFTAGSGETYLKLSGDTFSAGAGDAGWLFDFETHSASSGSVLDLGAITWSSGDLTVHLGHDARLLISEDTDLSNISLSLTGGVAVGQIIVADGTTLTLTAAQLNAIADAGLDIVGESGLQSTGVVNVVELGGGQYDLTQVQSELVGTATLAEDDVTLDALTDLGEFSITLDALSGDNDDLSGQTIRFQTKAQAEREIIVNAPDGDTDNTNSTNVAWLFTDAPSAPINTDQYSEQLGRLWVTSDLITNAGGDVENLYTSLPDTIVRSDFTDSAALTILLLSSEVHREAEYVAFTDLSSTGLVFSDDDLGEHVKTLDLSLGGQVNLGDITIGNNTDGTYDPESAQFESLTVHSYRALHTDNVLASEHFINNNNGVDESGEKEQPENHNTIDTISVDSAGTPVYSLRNIVLDTGEVSVVGDGSLGAGADLRIDTIVFNAEGTDKSTNLTVNGDNTVTVDVLDLSDDSLADVDGHVTFNISGDGNLVVDDVLDSALGQILLGDDSSATSAEINTALTSDASIKGITLGDNVTTFIVNNTGAGDLNVTGGSPALQGESLKNLVINAESGDITVGGAVPTGMMEGAFYGINTGTVDGSTQYPSLKYLETSGQHDVVAYLDGVADGFTYNHGAGADSQVWLDNVTLGTSESWTFNLDGADAGNGATLSLTDVASFGAGSLTINAGNDGDIHVWGENSEVDLRALTALEINGTDVGVHLDTGMRLLMTDQQFYGKDGEPKFDLVFTGPGQTLRADNNDDLTEVRGLCEIIIQPGDTVTLTPEQAAIARVGENGTVGDLRDATVTVQFSPYQTTLDVSVVGVDTLEIVGEQTDLDYLDAYLNDFRISLTAAQVDGLTAYTNSENVTGQVFVDVYNLGDDVVDLSIIPNADAGEITLASDTVVLDPATNLGDLDATTPEGFDTINVEDNSLTLTAAQADGRTIYDNGSDGTTSTGAGTVIVTDLEDTPAADLSTIIAGDEQAQLDVNGATVNFVGDLGRDMTVTVTNSDDLNGGTLIFDSTDGSMISARTEFVLTEGDDITFELDAADAHELTVTGNDNTVEVNNLDGDETDLTGFSVTTGGSLTANVPTDATLHAATQLGDFDVEVQGDTVLTLDFTQFADHGAGKFSGTDVYNNTDPQNVAGSQLAITGYDGSQALASDDLGEDLVISTLTVAGPSGNVVTAHPDSDFSNVDEIVIPAGVTLNMTADQFQQIMTSTTVVGDGTLNITGFGSDPAHLNINLSSVEAQAGTITLDPNVSSVVLKSTAILDGTASSGDTAFSFVYTADGQALVLSSEIQADGRGVNGGTFDDTILALGFTSADDDAIIEAGDFNVENVWLVSEYLYNEFSLSNLPANIEQILPNLPGNAGNGDPLVVTLKPASELLDGFGDPDAIDTADRVVVVSDNHDVDASVVFNDLTAREISSLTLTLEGDATITGNLALPQNKDPLKTLETTGKLPALFKSLVINSVDVTGAATGPNEIRGSIFADDGDDGLESTAETFELTVASMTVSGTDESIAFDGAFIVLDDGDTEADIAAKLAAATYDNWVAEVTSLGVVRFTYKIPGDYTDGNEVEAADFALSTQLSGNVTVINSTDTTPTQAGAHLAEENNLYNITINAEHDLIISGELELSYVTRSNTLKDETVEGTITINGDADVTIGSVNTDDVHITGVTLNHTGTGTVNAPGTSPGAALGNTETLTINTMGSVNLGTVGEVDKPGVAGAELSVININTDGVSNGTVNLGVIADIDSTGGFTLTAAAGNVTATLGADVLTSGTWSFLGTDDNIALTISGTTFAGGNLVLDNVVLTLGSDVDMSALTSVAGLDQVVIPEGYTLTLTAEQASGAVISGAGTLEIIGDLPAGYDFSQLTVENQDYSGVTNGGEALVLDLSAHTGIDFTITGSDFDDIITTADGNDTIYGGFGDDTLDGGAGADTIYGGEDNDTIVYDESDISVDGGNGSDTLTAADWDNSLDGTTGVIIDLTDTTDAFTSFENVIGSAYNDFVFGDATVESIETGAGFDIISMGEYLDANVVINGGAGQDVLAFEYSIGTSAADLLNQVSGVETLILSAANTGDVNITVGNDTLVAANETLVINAGSLTGQQRLVFDGRAETDGDFDITGGAGNDIIIGGNQPNSDVITGGAGDDILTGNAGNDTFNVDQGSDTITDLSESDILVVSPAASATAYVTGDWTATAATENNGTGPVELILGQVDPLTGTVTDADAYEDSGFTIDLGNVTNGTSGFNLTTSGPNLNFTLIGSAFDDTLTVTANAALNENASLGDFAVTLAEGMQLTLSYDQLTETGLGNFQGTGPATTEETLVVTGYNGEAFDSTGLGSQVLIATLKLAAEGTAAQPTTITIDPTADLSKVGQIEIPANVTLNMTAAQYQSLGSNGSFADKVIGNGTLNITEMSSDHSDIDLSSVHPNVIAGSITLAATETNVLFDKNAVLDGSGNPIDKFSIDFSADGQNVTLSTETQADGRVVNGGAFTDTTLTLGFTNADATDGNANIAAGGFDVENVWILNEYLYNEFGLTNQPANFEAILENLRDQASNGETLVVTVKDAATLLLDGTADPDALNTTDRVVVIDENVTLDASTAFEDVSVPTDGEVSTLSLTLEGNSVITGNLQLPQSNDPLAMYTADGKLPGLFKALVINSVDVTGTATAPNEIRGNIFADNGTDGVNSESRAETFTLTLDTNLLVSGSNSGITFDGALVALTDGDDEFDVAAKLANASYDNWTAEDLGGGVVEFTYKIAGDLTTDPQLSDFTFDAQGLTTNLTGAFNITQQGVFNANENNLYNITINADHDLVISGELELSYLTRSNALKDETVAATITINGDADVTIGSVNTDDEHISGVTLIHNGTGTVTAPGTSPGAALGNTETLTINTMGTVVLGTAGNDDKPGVAGADLSVININTDGVSNGTVNLGVIGSVDLLDFTFNMGDGNATAVLGDGVDPTGTFTVFGNDNLTLGLEDGALGGAGSVTFNDLVLDVPGTVEVGALTVLNLSGVTLTGDGNLDITSAVSVVFDAAAPLVVGANTTLTITGAQVDGQTITGEGNLVLEGLTGTEDLGSIDVEGDITYNATVGELTLTQALADGNTVNLGAAPGVVTIVEVGATLYADLSGINGNLVADVVITLDQDTTATADFMLQDDVDFTFTGGFAVDFTTVAPDVFAILDTGEITVDTGTTLKATAEQLSGITVVGDGSVIITDIENAPYADLSRIGSNVTTTVELTEDVVLTADAKAPAGDLVLTGAFELDATAVFVDDWIPNFTTLESGTVLKLTPAQADALDIRGAGDLVITTLTKALLADVNTLDGSIDLSGIMTNPGDTGTVSLTIDSTGDIIFDNSTHIGIANIDIIGTGTVDASEVSGGGIDRNEVTTPADFSDDTVATINVGADATLNLAAGQTGVYSDDGDDTNDAKLIVTGDGDVTVEDLSLNSAADLSGITVTGTVAAAVDSTVEFTGRLGTGVLVGIGNGSTFTTTYSVATGNSFVYQSGDTNERLEVTVDASGADADFTTISSAINDSRAVIDETLTFTGDFSDFAVYLRDSVELTVDAAKVDGLLVDGIGTNEAAIITGLDASDANLSLVNTDFIYLDVTEGDAVVLADFLLAVSKAYTITGGNLLDVSAATVLDFADLDVDTDTTLRATATQLDLETVNGFGDVIVTGLHTSGANLSNITPTGGVTLDVIDGDAAVINSFTLAAGVDYTVDGGNVLDLRNAADDVLDTISSLTIDADTTLLARAAQLAGVTVTGTGSVTVTEIHNTTGADLSGVTVDGGVELNLTGVGATVAAGFQLADGVDYTVISDTLPTETFDLTAATALGDTTTMTFTVDSSAVLEATAAQLDGVTVEGDGDVIVEDLGLALSADLSGITTTGTVTATIDTSAIFTGNLGKAVVTVADGQTLTTFLDSLDSSTINKVTDGAVSIDGSVESDGITPILTDAVHTIAGSADYTVTGLISDLSAAAVSGDLDVTTGADASVNVDLGSGVNTIDAEALLNGQTLTVEDSANHQAGAIVGTVNGNINASAVADGDSDSDTGGLMLIGGAGDNLIIGSANNDAIDGGDGTDTIDAGAGDDTVAYSADYLTTDSIDGGAGNDLLVLDSGDGITVDLSSTTDAYVNFEHIAGGTGNDVFTGDNGNNVLMGGQGQDDLIGGAGDDWLFGDEGLDELLGGTGADTFVFAKGDSLVVIGNGVDENPGGGDDTIDVAQADIIHDFSAAEDQLSLIDVTVENYSAVDGSAYAGTSIDFLNAALAHFSDNDADATTVDVFVAYDVAGSGDAWMLADMDGDGAVGTGDVFIVLVGVDSNAGIMNASYITGDLPVLNNPMLIA